MNEEFARGEPSIVFVQINAVANRAAGKGYENEGYYSNIQFKFCPIENIHVMRGSLQKLLESETTSVGNRMPTQRLFQHVK